MSNELYEVLQKDNRELKGVNTWEKTPLNDAFDKYLQDSIPSNFLFYIHGMGGSGKSYLVKNWKDNQTKDCFSVYVDLSDCGGESDVYYKIAKALQAYYRSYSNVTWSDEDKKTREKFNRFIQIYEWIKGIYRSDLSYRQNAINLTSNIANIVSQELGKAKGDETKNGVWDILLKLTDKIPYVRQLKWVVDTLIDIQKIKEKEGLKKEIVKVLSEFDNRVMREQLFLEELVSAMPKNLKKVIILDNFQLNRENDLGRTHGWLDKKGKIMNKMNAFWVVASRGERGELFAGRFDKNIEEYEVNGFQRKMAIAYLKSNCGFPEKEEDFISAMLEACYYGEGDVASEDKTYLPYLLRLIVLYYWNLKEDVSRPVKPEMFVNLHEEHIFVGYYFYKDLSDLMINAFQILSCLSTWDDTWIDKVREKFDNHLLNAKNLLMHKAPIEKLDGSGFKLHEAIKEALYQNEQNYIKKDVLSFLYESFIETYDNGRGALDCVWGNLNRIQDYLQVVFEYIKMQPDQIQQKEKLRGIRGAIARIYNANKARGTVSERFAEVYRIYIRKVKEVLYPTAECHDSEELGLDNQIEFDEDTTYYAGCFMKLADLYTNMNKYGDAKNVELACVKFWKDQKDKINDTENIRYYRCWLQKIRALNSVAYDASATHDYIIAYENGRKGLDEVIRLGNVCIEKIIRENDYESAKDLVSILNVEQSLPLKPGIGQLSEEQHIDDFETLYKMIQEWRDKEESENEDSYVKVLYELVFDVGQNLRGNYPWYCLQVSRFALPGEIAETNCRKEVENRSYSFGIHTYWMRRAMCRVVEKGKDTDKSISFNKKMLRSYHNICVYFSESEKVETACFLEKEVMAEMSRLIGRGSLNERAEIFLENIGKGNVDELPMWLWEELKLNKESGREFFSQYDELIESMQYLGDYYLKLKLYSYACEVLKKVMLYRVVRLDILDTKTLDTTCRLLEACIGYANQNEKDTTPKELVDYVDNLLQFAQVFEVDNFLSKGVKRKLCKLTQIRATCYK